jgi:cell division septation protein DedD
MRGNIVWLLLALWMFTIGTALADTGPDYSAEFDRGLKAYDAGQYATAYEIWWKIKNEDLAAMRNVALMLRKGQGVKKDAKKAQDLFEIAANTGMINAEVDLAEMLLNGEAGPSDPKRALGLLQAAASGQHPIAQYLLGQMYETGNAVPKDSKKAIELYTAAARGGLKDAKDRLAAMGVTQPQSSPGPTPDTATEIPPPSITELPPKPVASIATMVSGSPPAQLPSKPAPVTATALPPPAALRPEALPVSAAQKPEAGAYSLQLGSFKSVASAEAAWTATHGKDLLTSSPHQVKQVELGDKGTWYRLLVAGFKDLSAATTLCDRLKAAGDRCIIVRSDA